MTEKHLTNVTFKELGLAEPLIKALDAKGFQYCTPIQAKALPYLLNNQDVAGQAQTGTGKTATFLLALLHDLITLPEIAGRKPYEPRALILAPTRELAVQIYEDAKELTQFTDFKLGIVYGGADYQKQKDQFDSGVDILIGTTGRVIDYFKQNVFFLSGIDAVVLDEADRMFDLGFIQDIRYLYRRMPPPNDRLNMLFSATLSHRVQELAYEHMNNPQHVHVQPEQVTAEAIEQSIFYPSNNEKLPLLVGLIQKAQPEKAIIFTNTKRDAEMVHCCLAGNDFSSALLTGDVPQKKRLALLKKIKSGEVKFLVATDVAARGLHIDEVSHVYNFDLPDDAEDFVHRIGRTARAGAKGAAVSFACEDNAVHLPEIETLIGFTLPKQDIDGSLLAELKPSIKLNTVRNSNHSNNRRRSNNTRRPRRRPSAKPQS
ncbi:MAG: ATP-dependent RNA helicase RhlB [Pseudomonadota bacterium]